MGEVMLFPMDILRAKFFSKASTEHGAKMEIRSYQKMVELYTEPGQTILDPMSGVGTVHWAATLGRNSIGIEIEDRFVEIQTENMAMLGKNPGFTGTAQLLHGDCRRHMPVKADAVIFSPPYGTTFANVTQDKFRAEKGLQRFYGSETGNVGNLGNYVDYVLAMEEVYKLCNRCLDIGGIMVFVTKDYVLQKKRVYVTRDNIRVALMAGFEIVDIHQRFVNPKVLQIKNWSKMDERGEQNTELRIATEEFVVVRKTGDV